VIWLLFTIILFYLCFQVFFKSGNETLILEQRYIETLRNQYDHTSEFFIDRNFSLTNMMKNCLFLQLGSELAEKAIEKPIEFKMTPDSLSNAKDVS